MAEYEWVEKIRARGWENALSLALDVLEPLGPLGAQQLWVAQPAARVNGGWYDALAGLAQTLEEPGGVEHLRRLLDEDEEL